LYEDVEDRRYLAEVDSRRRHAVAILKSIERWHKPARLLEIGSQAGVLLRAAEDRGWTASGIEPSRWAVSTGRSTFNVNLINGSLESADYPPESFECIVMVDVLEHLVDPLVALQRCRPWLTKDGILALSTVNMDTLAAKVLGTHWPGFMDMHLTYFTTTALREYLRRSQFRWLTARADTRSFSLGYVGSRLQHNGWALRTAGRMINLPLIRRIPLSFPTRDLILVVAAASAD
jgi:2-polyprenyl-3-methyl-5-hydroxy-6-metoxy-1,4-benzoquinol methylase